MRFQKCFPWNVVGTMCVFGIITGCAATQVGLEKKDLKVQTKMSKSIFLNLDAQIEKTAFVEIKNTSDKDIDLTNAIKQSVRNRGYKVVDDAKQAAYIYQGNILYVGEADPAAIETALTKGYGSTVGGAAVGGAIGWWQGGGQGAAIGGAAGGLLASAAELVTGSLTKDVTYTIVTDLQLTEKTTEGKKVHQARVASSAEQVNLEWEEAEGKLVEGLAKSLGGLL